MNRLKAIWRCVFHACLPPCVERQFHGYCHYLDNEDGSRRENPWSYWGHMRANLKSALVLITYRPLSKEDREFHGI